MEHHYTLPRLLVKGRLDLSAHLELHEEQGHYLKNVVRLRAGDRLRVFDGQSGEYLAHLEQMDKKTTTIRVDEKLKGQPVPGTPVSLVFPPLKKEALDFLIEKSTELGVSAFFPVLTAQSDVRALNIERVQSQIVQAAEQCERLSVPHVFALQPLEKALAGWSPCVPLYVAIERDDSAEELSRLDRTDNKKGYGVLIGPAGGWRAEEKEMFKRLPFIRPVSLGEHILRAETAAIATLSALKFLKEK